MGRMLGNEGRNDGNTAYVKHIALCGLLTALMLMLGYVESRIPLIYGIPGIKLGLSNTVLLYAVYLLPFPFTPGLMLVKVLLSALLFGSPFAIVFSLAGGVFSVCGMLLACRVVKFSIIGVSVTGAFFHNVGQMLVALWLVRNVHILYYLAVLTLAAVGTGLLTGTVAGVVMKAIGTKQGG